MGVLKIDLTPEEEKVFEFRLFQFQGLQVAINQYLNTSDLQYNEEHYNRLTDTYAEKYRLLTENIINLLNNRQYKDILVQGFNYEYTKGCLKLYM
jgi:hypothetical protein